MSLDIMGVISQAFAMMKQRLAALSGIWLLFFVILSVVSLLFFGGMMSSVTQLVMMDDPSALGAGMIGTIALFYMFYLLLNFAQSVSLTHQASPSHYPGFGESLTAGFKSVPTLLGLTLLLIVGYIIALIPIGILGFIFALLGETGSVLFAIVTVVLAIWVGCRLSLIMPIIAVDGEMNPITAITRSWKLTSGHVLAIFLALLAFIVIVVVVIFVLVAIFGAMSGATFDTTGASATGLGVSVIIALVVFMVFWAALVIFSSSFVASLHHALAGPQTTAETFS